VLPLAIDQTRSERSRGPIRAAEPADREPAPAASLGLPVRERGAAAGAILALFAYYVASMARDLSLYDSGELALAAVQLGLGHPPGQPLHTLLGFCLSRLPGIAPLVGVGLASALPAALTLLPATSLAQGLLGQHRSRMLDRAVPWLLAALGLHPALWEPATRVEVYALATFFAVWAAARLQSAGPGVTLQAGIALGLAASANPMVALCMGVALAPGLLLRVSREAGSTRALAGAVGGGLLGLLPYAYLAFVARRSDVMVWGAPRDAVSLWRYLSLRDYTHNQHVPFADFVGHLLAWFGWAAEHGLLVPILLGIAGWIARGSRSRIGRLTSPLLLALLVSVISSNAVWDLDVPDYNGYTASAIWLLCAGAVAACAEICATRFATAGGLLAAGMALSAMFSPPAVFARTRHRDRLARELAEQVLREAPPHAIVVSLSDGFAGSLFYVQEAEHQRPDAVVLAYGLARSSWHWERIYRMHPELTPIALKGPGGTPGRVRRFLDANPGRSVLIENASIAAELGLSACAGGLYLRAREGCEAGSSEPFDAPGLLSRNLQALGEGSPSAAGAIALTAFQLGESLWRIDRPDAAYATLLSGVPVRNRPGVTPSPEHLRRAAPLRRPLPPWRRGAALGDPARNLFLAALLCQAAGLEEAAAELGRAAAALGLPEARGGDPT
jgi:hypothetical protein